jgi:DNA (cytosine-5)-methyltransferase 1
MRAISLFSGAGGDTIGMENAGIHVVAFSESNKRAVETHKVNFPNCEWLHHKDDGDITKIPDGIFLSYANTIDLIMGGFPCQAYSHAGKKKSIEDPRGQLFLEFARVVRLIKPKYVIGENVPGLLQRKVNDEYVFPLILKAFEEQGYKMWYKVLDAADFATPQKRKRLLIVGSKDHDIDFSFPKAMGTKTIKDILENTLANAAVIPNPPENIVYAFTNIATDIENAPIGTPHPFLLRNIELNRLSFGKRDSPYHGEILHPDKPCKTIICAYSFQPRLYVAIKEKDKAYVRTLTCRELAQIQGFPADYKFMGSHNEQVKQIGNAVPPNIITAICKQFPPT